MRAPRTVGGTLAALVGVSLALWGLIVWATWSALQVIQ